MFGFIKKIGHWLLNLVFPIRCLGCGRFDIWLCDECLSQTRTARAECPQCRQPNQNSRTCVACQTETALDRLIVWTDYQTPLVQKSIHALKYGFVSGLAIILGRMLAQRILESVSPMPSNIVLVPVPLHWQRQNERGFNQADLLAHGCAKVLQLPYQPKALKRLKHTPPQATLSRQDRLTNMVSLFGINPKLDLSDKIVIIIDDVATTTATLKECSTMLKKAGAIEVWGAVLARSHD
jgi:ComF family protein